MDHTSVEGPHGSVLSNGCDCGVSNILCRAEISFCNFVFVNLQIVFVIFFNCKILGQIVADSESNHRTDNIMEHTAHCSLQGFRALGWPPQVFVTLQTGFCKKNQTFSTQKLFWPGNFWMAFNINKVSNGPVILRGRKSVVLVGASIDDPSVSRLPSL